MVAIMNWLTKYLCHSWPWIWSVCRNQNPVLFSSFITYQCILNKSNASAISRSGTGYSSFLWESWHSIFSFCIVFSTDHCLPFCPLYCSSFDLRFLITPLVSSNFLFFWQFNRKCYLPQFDVFTFLVLNNNTFNF
jgi:hypothetical protein